MARFADGRMGARHVPVVEVKKPEESHIPGTTTRSSRSFHPWEYYKILKIIPGEEAFRPMSEGGRPLLAKP